MVNVRIAITFVLKIIFEHMMQLHFIGCFKLEEKKSEFSFHADNGNS